MKRYCLFFFLACGLWAQSNVARQGQSNTYSTGKQDASAATHTLPTIVVANVGALPASGCTPGELAVVTAATLGQQIYENSGSGACTWTQQLNTGSSNGGGITVYSAASLSLTGTQFIPIGGGGLPNSTETNVDTAAPTAATITNFDVQMSAAPGIGNSVAFTWRKNASSQSLTCTISGGAATSCSDNTHSFNVSQGDLLTIQLVTTGVIAGTPNLVITAQFGTVGSNGTVNASSQFQVGEYLAAGTAITGVSIPNCPDSGGNHVNFASGTGVFTCGTTSSTAAQLHSIGFNIDGGGVAITTGDIKIYPPVDFACTINRIDISADQSGSITVDVWKAASAIPTSGNKISASAPLTLSSAQLSQNGSLTGWSTSVSVGDVFGFSVATVSTVTRVTGVIWCQ